MWRACCTSIRKLLTLSLTLGVSIEAVLLCLQITIDVMHIGRLYVGSETLSLLIAAQCLMLWFRFQFFIRYSPLLDKASAAHHSTSSNHMNTSCWYQPCCKIWCQLLLGLTHHKSAMSMPIITSDCGTQYRNEYTCSLASVLSRPTCIAYIMNEPPQP